MQTYSPSHLARRRWRIVINHVLTSIRFCDILKNKLPARIKSIRKYQSFQPIEDVREIREFFASLHHLERQIGISKIFQIEIGATLPTREVEPIVIDLYLAERQTLRTQQINHIRLTDGSIRPINERNDTTVASIQTFPANCDYYHFIAHGPNLLTNPLPNNWLQTLRTTPFPAISNTSFHVTSNSMLVLQTPNSPEQHHVISYGEDHHWFDSVYTMKTKNLTYTMKLAFLNFREDESDHSLPDNKWVYINTLGITNRTSYFVISTKRLPVSLYYPLSVENVQWLTKHAKGADFFGFHMASVRCNGIENSLTDLHLIVADIYLPDENNNLIAYQGRIEYQSHPDSRTIVSNSEQLARAIIWTMVKETNDQDLLENEWRQLKKDSSTLKYVMDPYFADLLFYKKRSGKWKSGYFIGLVLDNLMKNSEVDFRLLGPVSYDSVHNQENDFEDELEIEVDGEIISYKHKLPYITLAVFVTFVLLAALLFICLVVFTDSSVADIIQATGVVLLSGAIGVSGLVHTLQYGAWPLNYALRGRGVARSFDKLRRTIADDVKIFKELVSREKLRSVLSSTGSRFIPHESFGSENIANWFRVRTAIEAGAEIRLTKNSTVSYKAIRSAPYGTLRNHAENKLSVSYENLADEDEIPTVWRFSEPDPKALIG